MTEARDTMRAHAVRRFFQRAGLALSVPEYELICNHLRNTQVLPIAMGYSGRKFYRVKYRGTRLFACWDPSNDCVVTFVPRLPMGTAVPLTEAA